MAESISTTKDKIMRLEGKSAIISGAATGIGAAAVRRFSAEGARVAILDLNVEEGKKLADELGGEEAGIYFFECDVADVQAVRSAVDQAADKFGTLDIVFSNAGVGTPTVGGTVESIDPDRWDLAFDVNTRGMYAMVGAAIPYMRGNGGSIILTSSTYAFIGVPERPTHAYAASKGALVALTRAMAVTYGPENIRVNSLAPGVTRTRLNDDIAAQPEAMQRVIQDIPLGRFGTVDELASCALFLASDDSSFVTGQVLLADGGQTVA
jgi:NAD(P)-dependent dehydrogenase (short-subunit alcohol dehydrogenase family)